MKNSFEQPTLKNSEEQDVCEHGNPKGLCEVCDEKNKVEIKNEKIDYSNQLHLKKILENPQEPIDFKNCGVHEFRKIIFGTNSRFRERDGRALLNSFGTKKGITENMIALLNFAGIEREYLDYNNTLHLKEILGKSKENINLNICGVKEFRKMVFGTGSRFKEINGYVLLDNFGTKKQDTENMIDLLNFAGIEHENEKTGDKKEEVLKQSLENFVQEISNAETQDKMAKKIREIMELLPENACDILLKYHPEYKGLNIGYVKSVIADYLGDFLLIRKLWEIKDVEITKELFSEEQFAEALFLKFKDASFNFFQREKKLIRK